MGTHWKRGTVGWEGLSAPVRGCRSGLPLNLWLLSAVVFAALRLQVKSQVRARACVFLGGSRGPPKLGDWVLAETPRGRELRALGRPFTCQRVALEPPPNGSPWSCSASFWGNLRRVWRSSTYRSPLGLGGREARRSLTFMVGVSAALSARAGAQAEGRRGAGTRGQLGCCGRRVTRRSRVAARVKH